VTAIGTTAAAGVVLLASWQAGRTGSSTAGGVHIVASPGGSPAASGRSSGRTSATRGATTATTRTVTGALVQTPYGNVQVRVTVHGNRITNIVAVHLTDSSNTSVQISAGAEPTLRSEALSAQSAHIDLVSGATYTSEGYKTSLQAALDAAHL
jgi:uncharacterized protein with FMN-binding domain